MNVHEIFESIHGEVNGHHQGRICTFVRFNGCNLRCDYCDTKITQSTKVQNNLSVQSIVQEVIKLNNTHVCLTGGEPLWRNNPSLLALMHTLCTEGFKLSVETNGSIDVTLFYKYVDSFVIDYKLDYPEKMYVPNFECLRSTDVIKFVIRNEEEFSKAIEVINNIIPVDNQSIVAFSPVKDLMSESELAHLLLEAKPRNALLSVQIHKMLNLS